MKRAREEAATGLQLLQDSSRSEHDGGERLKGFREEFDKVCAKGEDRITRSQLEKILMRRCYRKRKTEFKTLASAGERGSRSSPVYDQSAAAVKCDRSAAMLLVKEAFALFEDQPTMSFDNFVSACSLWERRQAAGNGDHNGKGATDVIRGSWGDLSGKFGDKSPGGHPPSGSSSSSFLSRLSSRVTMISSAFAPHESGGESGGSAVSRSKSLSFDQAGLRQRPSMANVTASPEGRKASSFEASTAHDSKLSADRKTLSFDGAPVKQVPRTSLRAEQLMRHRSRSVTKTTAHQQRPLSGGVKGRATPRKLPPFAMDIVRSESC
mmetsp:Transcript_21125/g.48876  ORF Transcript_21125/g.48876 Transcript_21125/m.48876 type:complete len:323 (+) Transcript_21125:1-969(+)